MACFESYLPTLFECVEGEEGRMVRNGKGMWEKRGKQMKE
jgi:hypothetical protein